MAFRFPLKALWRVRAIYERREGQRLAALNQKLKQVEKQLAALKKGHLERVGSLAGNMQRGITGAELHFKGRVQIRA